MKRFRKLFPSRAAILLLMTMLTSVGAWATQWATSLSGNATDGYYINMPEKGTANSFENAATLDLSNSSVTTFKLYDDGGKDSNYSENYSGYLVINAPTGALINISGSIVTMDGWGRLSVYDGTDVNSLTPKYLLNGISGTVNGIDATSTGNVITVQFRNMNSNTYAGLDLTVTIIQLDNHDLQNATLTGVESGYSYTGSAITVTPTVTAADGTTLTPGTDYAVTFKKGNQTVTDVIDTGDYTLTATGISPYTGSLSKDFYVYKNYDGLSVDTDYNPGDDGFYYVNTPEGTTSNPGHATVTLSNADVTAFKVYGGGGKNGGSPSHYAGYLTLTAPTGYHLQVTGNALYATLAFYDGVYNGTGTAPATVGDKAQYTASDGNDWTLSLTTDNHIVSSGETLTIYSNSPSGRTVHLTVNLVLDTNMPKTGSKTMNILNDKITTFKVYDDGGPNGNYSRDCDGYLIMTAPTGYKLQVTGSMKTQSNLDYLTIYDGEYDGTGTAPAYIGDEKYTNNTSQTLDIGSRTSTGNVMTLYFKSLRGGSEDGYATGLDLNVTLVAPAPLDINIAGGLPDGCSVAADPTTAAPGTGVALTATAATGYVLNDLTVTDESSNVVDIDWNPFATSATFTMPNTAATVSPTFSNAKTADDGLYVRMGVTGHKTAAFPEGVTSFKVYDDGGVSNPYTNNCNTTLTLTAPTGYVIQLSGTVHVAQGNVSDRLNIYDGTEASGTILAQEYNTGSSPKAIDYVYSTSMTLQFITSNNVDAAGLDLTATLVSANTEYTVNVVNPNPTTGCSVTTDKTSAKVDETVTLTVNTAPGYLLENMSLTYNNYYTQLTPNQEDASKYTFTMPAADVTVTPTFSPIDYTVTLNATGETEKASISGTTEGKAHVGDIITLTADEGYSLSDVTVTYGDNQSVTVTKVSDAEYTFEMPAADATVSATVAGNAYTVAFDKNATDATGTMDQQTFTYGTAQNLTANAFTREGYAFMGWNTQADGNGTTYSDEQEVNNLTTEAGATVTLYAQWGLTEWGISNGQDGSQDKPYYISTTDDLNKLAERVIAGNNYSGVYFKVTEDITYNPNSLTLDNGKSNYTVIGKSVLTGSHEDELSGTIIIIYDYDYHSFNGHFDGDGHTISGIVVNDNGERNGLFGYTYGAEIKNVKLANSTIKGINHIGGIVGYAENGSNISNCHVGSDVLIENTGEEHSWFYGYYTGGIAGYNEGGTISNCTCAASVKGTQDGAGIVSRADCNVKNCLFTGTVREGTTSGSILWEKKSGYTYEHNYYTPNGNVKGVGGWGSSYAAYDLTDNDGAVPATILSDDTAVPTSMSGTVAFRREFKGGVASTIVLPFDQTAGSEGKYYEFSGVTEVNGKWTATMTEATTLQANKPYLFKAAGTEAHQPVLFHGAANYSAAGTTSVGDWSLVGTYARKDWTSENYGKDYGFAAADATGLNGEDIKAGDFVKFGPGAWVRPMRSYLTFTGSTEPWASAPAMNRAAASDLPNSISVVLIDADGTVTKIDAADLGIEFDTTAWYDLNGRRLNGMPTAKGLYINNGRKVVIK